MYKQTFTKLTILNSVYKKLCKGEKDFNLKILCVGLISAEGQVKTFSPIVS